MRPFIVVAGKKTKASPKLADAMRNAGITHAGLANNHAIDQGALGLEDTIQALEASQAA